jgi:hypothetical protein
LDKRNATSAINAQGLKLSFTGRSYGGNVGIIKFRLRTDERTDDKGDGWLSPEYTMTLPLSGAMPGDLYHVTFGASDNLADNLVDGVNYLDIAIANQADGGFW